MFFGGARNKDKPMRFLVKAKTISPVSFDFTMFEVNDESELRKLVVDALISKLSGVGIEIEGEIIDGEDKLENDSGHIIKN
jgi:hypothetical protein